MANISACQGHIPRSELELGLAAERRYQSVLVGLGRNDCDGHPRRRILNQECHKAHDIGITMNGKGNGEAWNVGEDLALLGAGIMQRAGCGRWLTGRQA